jgi:hypothetical protein
MVMQPDRARTVSRRALAVLTAAVLLAHVVLLQDDSVRLSFQPPHSAPAFSTRTLTPPSHPPAAQAVRPMPKRVRPPAAVAKQMPQASDVKPAPAPSNGDLFAPPPAVSDTDALASAVQGSTPEPVNEPEPVPRPPREAAGLAHAVQVAAPARIKYEVKGNKFPYSLNAELLWQQDGSHYDARLAFSAGFLPVLSQTSSGQITAQGLAPLRFADKKRSEVAAHFVREQGKISFSANTPDAPLLDGAQDRLSILLQLGAMMAGDPGAYPQATTLTVQIVGPRDADLWLFTVGEEEILALPSGTQPARKLLRNPREAFDQKVELWLAPALGYLPVRLRITEANGDFVDQQWLSSEPAP